MLQEQPYDQVGWFARFEDSPNLGEEGLLLEDAENSHRAFEHVDAILQIIITIVHLSSLEIMKTGCSLELITFVTIIAN